MGRTASKFNSEDYYAEDTLARTFRDQFKFGRRTVEKCDWNVGLMPNAEHSCEGLGDEKPGIK